MNRASPVSEKTFGLDKVRKMNKGMSMARKSAESGLLYEKQDRALLEIRAYVDYCLVSNEDISSQLRYVILFCDAAGVFHVLYYSSGK